MGNVNQSTDLTVGYGARDVAQGFTTGSNPGGNLPGVVQIRVLNLATGVTAKVATGLPGVGLPA